MAAVAVTNATGPPPIVVTSTSMAPGTLKNAAQCGWLPPQARAASDSCSLVQFRHPNLPFADHIEWVESARDVGFNAVVLEQAVAGYTGQATYELDYATSDGSIVAVALPTIDQIDEGPGSNISDHVVTLTSAGQVSIDGGLRSQAGALGFILKREATLDGVAPAVAGWRDGIAVLVRDDNSFQLVEEALVATETPYEDWVSRYATPAPEPERSVQLARVWRGAGVAGAGLLLVLLVIWFLMDRIAASAESHEARSLALATDAAEHRQEALEQRDDAMAAKAQAELSEARANDWSNESELRRRVLEVILQAAHHQLNREIIQVGYVADDLEVDGVDVSDLRACATALHDGRDRITSLARLEATNAELHLSEVSAAELVPDVQGLECRSADGTPFSGDRLLLQTYVRTVMEVARDLGRATWFSVETNAEEIRLLSNGEFDVERLRQSWGRNEMEQESWQGLLIARIARAHNADLHFADTPKGTLMTFTPQSESVVDLTDSAEMATTVAH